MNNLFAPGNNVISQAMKNSGEKLSDTYPRAIRNKTVYDRHRNGETYKEIASSLGITATRARQMAIDWEQHIVYHIFDCNYCHCATPKIRENDICVNCHRLYKEHTHD